MRTGFYLFAKNVWILKGGDGGKPLKKKKEKKYSFQLSGI